MVNRFFFKCQPRSLNAERIGFSTNGTRGDIYMQMNELDPTSHHIQKLKMDNTPKYNVKTTKVLEENIGQKLHDIGFGSSFFKYDTKSTSNQSKHKVDLID